MKRLIVNADDFGLHPAVNHGIIEGYEKGCTPTISACIPPSTMVL